MTENGSRSLLSLTPCPSCPSARLRVADGRKWQSIITKLDMAAGSKIPLTVQLWPCPSSFNFNHSSTSFNSALQKITLLPNTISTTQQFVCLLYYIAFSNLFILFNFYYFSISQHTFNFTLALQLCLLQSHFVFCLLNNKHHNTTVCTFLIIAFI